MTNRLEIAKLRNQIDIWEGNIEDANDNASPKMDIDKFERYFRINIK